MMDVVARSCGLETSEIAFGVCRASEGNRTGQLARTGSWACFTHSFVAGSKVGLLIGPAAFKSFVKDRWMREAVYHCVQRRTNQLWGFQAQTGSGRGNLCSSTHCLCKHRLASTFLDQAWLSIPLVTQSESGKPRQSL